jgi:hypothetical protein
MANHDRLFQKAPVPEGRVEQKDDRKARGGKNYWNRIETWTWT